MKLRSTMWLMAIQVSLLVVEALAPDETIYVPIPYPVTSPYCRALQREDDNEKLRRAG